MKFGLLRLNLTSKIKVNQPQNNRYFNQGVLHFWPLIKIIVCSLHGFCVLAWVVPLVLLAASASELLILNMFLFCDTFVVCKSRCCRVLCEHTLKEFLNHALLEAGRHEASYATDWVEGKSMGAFTTLRDVAPRCLQMGFRASWPHEAAPLGTTPLGKACFLTTHQWKFSCFWGLPPELSMF